MGVHTCDITTHKKLITSISLVQDIFIGGWHAWCWADYSHSDANSDANLLLGYWWYKTRLFSVCCHCAPPRTGSGQEFSHTSIWSGISGASLNYGSTTMVEVCFLSPFELCISLWYIMYVRFWWVGRLWFISVYPCRVQQDRVHYMAVELLCMLAKPLLLVAWPLLCGYRGLLVECWNP